jgi:ribosomal protein S12 methylthiotransferase
LKYFLDPFGCVKNQVDAENMMSHLNNEGWENVSEAEEADLIIVNSCGFIESAKKESIEAVLNWRKLYPDKKILLAGCLAQRYSWELAGELTEVDGFFGVDDIAGITGIVEKIFHAEARRARRTQRGGEDFKIESGERPLLSLPGSAYVKISEGCNNNCSFCAIPLIRGKLVSRTIKDIVEECKTLLKRGIKELCIIGQDIGSYSDGLPELLEEISTLKGDFWVRLLYIHPDHFPLEILDVMERDTRFLPYFDIPFQHGSEKILTAMNRRGSKEKYLALLETIRKKLPNAVIRSTFLLGFPGETEEDFAELLDFQKKANLDWVGCFTYSREEGTKAYQMKGQVSKKTAEERKKTVEETQIPITEKNMERFIGQKLDVLIEEHIVGDDEEETFLLGRLYCQAPDIDGAAVVTCVEDNKKAGALVPCKVIARRGFDLEVRL